MHHHRRWHDQEFHSLVSKLKRKLLTIDFFSFQKFQFRCILLLEKFQGNCCKIITSPQAILRSRRFLFFIFDVLGFSVTPITRRCCFDWKRKRATNRVTSPLFDWFWNRRSYHLALSFFVHPSNRCVHEKKSWFCVVTEVDVFLYRTLFNAHQFTVVHTHHCRFFVFHHEFISTQFVTQELTKKNIARPFRIVWRVLSRGYVTFRF